MDYDVFLSCSSDDDLEGHRILEALEADGYHVCYHYRDFRHGSISDNTEAFVTRSKRTVCLLTENFIRRSAHSLLSLYLDLEYTVHAGNFHMIIATFADQLNFFRRG